MALPDPKVIAADLPHWSLEADGKAVTRTLKFADFPSAFAFMAQVAIAAEKADHHPE
ncbi:MAG: 4a-hydroxytetrahydrobiopterin dehydratase, partial [Pseudomonadota bacterium]